MSQADTIAALGLAFASSSVVTLVPIIAFVVTENFKHGGPLHLGLMGFGLFWLFTFAVNVALNGPEAVLG